MSKLKKLWKFFQPPIIVGIMTVTVMMGVGLLIWVGVWIAHLFIILPWPEWTVPG